MDGDYPNFRSIQDLLAAFYGFPFITQPEESDYTIGASVVPIGANVNGMRVVIILSNTGATDIAISFKYGVTITTGILIPSKGLYRLDWYYDGDLVQLPLYAISSGAGGTLHMVERFLTGA